MLMAIVLAGCQSVGGLDLNETIVKQIDVTTLEQRQTITFDMELNEAAEEFEVPAFVKNLQHVKIEISHAKLQANNQWLMGSLTFGKGTIPFELHIDQQAARIDIGGLARPLILDVSMLYEANSETLVNEVRTIAKQVLSYLVGSLPNPPGLTVEQVTTKINGTDTNLHKVHAAFNGEQLGDLVIQVMDNLANDEEGLRTTLRSIIEWVIALPPELKEQLDVVEIPTQEEIDESVEEGVETLLALFTEARDELTNTQKDNPEEWRIIFDSGIEVTTDVYVDQSLNIRKSDAELRIAPALFAEEDSPIRSIHIRSTLENWNVDGDVAIPAVQKPFNALEVEQLDEMRPYQIVRMLEKDSVLYDLLKNDMQIDDQYFTLSGTWGVPFLLDEDGAAYVPLRISVEGLEGRITYVDKDGLIKFYDPAGQNNVVLQVGSDEALLNGELIQLLSPLFVNGPYAYMSADDLFGMLDAEYEVELYDPFRGVNFEEWDMEMEDFDPSDYLEYTMTVVRDL